MAEVSLAVPGELVERVRESVLLLYVASAEALHLALRSGGEGRGGLANVDRQRARLASLDALLDRFDQYGSAPEREVELSGPADLLHDVLYGALIDAGERLAADCEAGWRGERPAGSVERTARTVIALDGLLRRVRG